MNRSRSMHSSVQYGRKLVNAGISGIRNGQDSARGEQPLSTIAAEAAQSSLTLAAMGACVGLASSCLLHRRNSLSKAVVLGSIGSALGFLAGFSWQTRNVTSSMAQAAARELRKARDERWLELNPIDYA